MFQYNAKNLIICFFIILVLSGCGGGGGGSEGVPIPPPIVNPPPAVIFSDSFDDGSGWVSRWDIKNDSFNQPHYWLEAGNKLQQQNNVIDYQDSYHTGTYVRLTDTSMSGISNFRFSVDITPLTNTIGGTNQNGNDVGIMFRYQNVRNYYRISMSARYGFTRFEKCTNGIFETLAVNARGYVENQPVTITAEVNGSIIIVWIGGDPVFAEVDASLPSGNVALYCQDNARFDNVLITENPLQPTVAIISPLAYSVTPASLVNLTATAVVLNKPAGGSVAFSLDGGSEIPIAGSGNVYSLLFPTVANGNHDVAAILRNADGTEVGSDTNSMVGTGGDYYVTIGDSITNGYGDEDDSNNDSSDGRMVSRQGYQARLSNLLTTETGRPQIVFNEGVLGDTVLDLESRIDSILDRHPRANRVLMMIGTNDSNAGNQTPANDFQNNVETITDQINVDGKQVWLAKTMPVYQSIAPPSGVLDATRDAFIVQYNNTIQQVAIASSGDDVFSGPNFYAVFNNPVGIYSDLLHPNDAGYRIMANEWSGTPIP